MISIITNKNDLIGLGFYNAFKTLYKNVNWITYPSEYSLIKDSKIVIINDFSKLESIIMDKKMIIILLKPQPIFEIKLKSNDIKYYIIEEYSNDKSFDDYILKEKFMYMKDNHIIMPYLSIYTKNNILFNYKNNLFNKNIEEFDYNKIIMIKNRKKGMIGNLKIKKLKILNNINKHQERKLIEENNIFQSFSDINKFDSKSLSYMSMGSLSMTNSIITKMYVNNVILNGNIKDIEEFNIERKSKLIENVQEIYNNYTFEKYVIILNKLL